MAKRRVGLLFLLLTLLASNSPSALADDSAPEHSTEYQRWELLNDVEWFGMNLGGGWAAPSNHMKADLLLFTIRWPSLYWTVLEMYPIFFYGFLGGGTRIGGRIFVGESGREEIRVGLGVGGGWFVPYETKWYEPDDDEWLWFPLVVGAVLIPHVQYIYNFEDVNVGVGLDLMIGVSPDKLDWYCYSPSYAIGPMVYFRFAVH